MDVPFHSSGALSRDHYAIVRKVESAQSSDIADQEICLEIKSIQDRIQDPRLSFAQRKELLIILLYCAMSVSRDVLPPNGFEFAFFHAINLAEGGKSINDKWVGYRFCAELMPLDHDLRLMLINTLRKDLESDDIPRICLALESLIESPTEDVIPAVESCLQVLLSHPAVHIQKRTFLAIRALARFTPALLDRIHEPVLKILQDPDGQLFSTALVVVRQIARVKGVRRKLIVLLNSNLQQEVSYADNADYTLILKIVTALRYAGLSESTIPYLLDVLRMTSERSEPSTMHKAVILEIFALLSQADGKKLIRIQKSADISVVNCIRKLLTYDDPNDLTLFVTCLHYVPVSSWAGTDPDYATVLDAFEFERILQLANSPEESIRRKILDVLHQIDPAILDNHFQQVLQTVRSKSGSLKTGAILQLLEILSVRYSYSGKEYAAQVISLVDQIEGEKDSSPLSSVVSAVLSTHVGEREFRVGCAQKFVDMLVNVEQEPRITAMVIGVALVIEHPQSTEITPAELLRKLGRRLTNSPATVKHISVLAMLRIRAMCEKVPDETVEIIKAARQTSSGTLKMCCDLFLEFADKREELLSVIESHNVETLPDFFSALAGYQKKDRPRSQAAPSGLGESLLMSESKLRYQAYEAPKYTPRLQGRRDSSSARSASSVRSETDRGPSRLGSPPMTAGGLTLAAGIEDLSISMKATSLLKKDRSAKPGSKDTGFDLISLEGGGDPFSPFEAPVYGLAGAEGGFDVVWNGLEGVDDGRGWSSQTSEELIDRLRRLDDARVVVRRAEDEPFIGETKVLIYGPDELMNVLKSPSFFRPSSRPSSPAPVVQPRIDTPNASDRPARPHNKLSLSNLIRQPSQTPGQPAPPVLLVQDGSYLEMLSLKLSEAVSKALAQPAGVPAATDATAGKRPIPQGRGHALGSLIVSELNNSAHDPHIHRAVLRTLQRPLTVLLTNLSAQLMPTLAHPSFHTIPTASNPNVAFPNSVQQHAMSIAKFSEEFLQAFDQLGLGLYGDARGDGLKTIRDGLNSIITRVTNPLVATVRNEMIPLVEALESAQSIQQVKPTASTKPVTIYHPSITSLATLVPVYARALSSFTTSVLSHTSLANLLISVLWKALVALSHRVDAKPSPLLTPQSSPLLPVKKRRASPPSTTPPITPPPSRFILKLPPSRPPSPPAVPVAANAAADCKALYDLLVLLPRPSAEHDSTRLAREAVDEAFEGLCALPALLSIVNNAAQSEVQDRRALVHDLNNITTEIPTLIALPILLHAFGGPGTSSVASLLSLSEDEYRKGCLSGFARAEDCAVPIVQRVVAILQKDFQANEVLLQWLEMELVEIEGTA